MLLQDGPDVLSDSKVQSLRQYPARLTAAYLLARRCK